MSGDANEDGASARGPSGREAGLGSGAPGPGPAPGDTAGAGVDAGDAPVSRNLAAAWAVALGLFAGSVAGSVVTAPTAAAEIRHVAAFVLVFVPAVYLMITRRPALWRAKHPFVRFVVFVVSTMVAVVLGTALMHFAFGWAGEVVRVAEPVGALAGFAVAAWVTFLGGAERIWRELEARTDLEW
jgi:hypothetical protein